MYCGQWYSELDKLSWCDCIQNISVIISNIFFEHSSVLLSDNSRFQCDSKTESCFLFTTNTFMAQNTGRLKAMSLFLRALAHLLRLRLISINLNITYTSLHIFFSCDWVYIPIIAVKQKNDQGLPCAQRMLETVLPRIPLQTSSKVDCSRRL